MSISNKATEARMATMERMMAQFAAQAGMVGPGQPSGDQMIQPPPIQRTGDVNHALEEEDDEDNPMFTPKCSNEHKATVAAGPDARHALSPSAEPPNKMSKPAEQLTDGDSNMLGTDQAGQQRNIHHKGGGHMPPLDQSPQAQIDKPETSGNDEKC